MKKLILTTSIITLGLSAGFAVTAHANDKVSANASVSAEAPTTTDSLRGALDRAINKTEQAVDKAAGTVEEKYKKVKVAVLDRENKFTDLNLNSEYSAKTLLGKTIVDSKGDRIGQLDDILLDANGNIQSAVVSDGDFVGIGKKAEFDFSTAVRQEKDGKVMTSIAESDIKSARKFSSIPSGSYSVKELLDADIETANKALDLDLENITFSGNKAQYFVFEAENDKTNQDRYAGIEFSKVKLLPKNDNEVDLQLTASQEQSLLSHISTAAQ